MFCISCSVHGRPASLHLLSSSLCASFAPCLQAQLPRLARDRDDDWSYYFTLSSLALGCMYVAHSRSIHPCPCPCPCPCPIVHAPVQPPVKCVVVHMYYLHLDLYLSSVVLDGFHSLCKHAAAYLLTSSHHLFASCLVCLLDRSVVGGAEEAGESGRLLSKLRRDYTSSHAAAQLRDLDWPVAV
ncbi:hypothetical protein PVAP13_6NG358150 [Panicum virgatum]|uniref:Uncharacterized protein n=1 Tax=Panicum virgatum TaxID=38727 RepID=A0A8T0R4M2_PANVG|nr:hypothetical protein PVAP13_6NG358150 [Panicum virgatum]